MRRRRPRSSRALAGIPFAIVVVAGVILLMAYALPGLGVIYGSAFALIATALWYVGALARVTRMKRSAAIANMFLLTPAEFELHVANTYEALGYRANVTGRINDQGLDVIAEHSSTRIGIQCKRTSEPVGNEAVQQAYAGQAYYGCTAAAVIALAGFTRSASELAKSTGVQLIDGAAYAKLVATVSKSLESKPVWSVIPGTGILLPSVACAALSAGCFLLTLRQTTAVSQGASISYDANPEPSLQQPAVSQQLRPAEDASQVVLEYYNYQNIGEWGAAYNLLSRGLRSTSDFSYRKFVADRAGTESISARVLRSKGDRIFADVDWLQNGIESRLTGYWVVELQDGGWKLDDYYFERLRQ